MKQGSFRPCAGDCGAILHCGDLFVPWSICLWINPKCVDVRILYVRRSIALSGGFVESRLGVTAEAELNSGRGSDRAVQ